jgi:hypothetical protein
MEQRMQVPEVKELLSKIHVTTVYGLLARQMHTNESATALTEGGGLNTDDYPLLEYLAPRSLYIGDSAVKVINQDLRLTQSHGLLLEQYMAQHTPTQADYKGVIEALVDVRMANHDMALKIAEYYITRWPDDDGVAYTLASILEGMGRVDEALKYATSAANRRNKDAMDMVARLQRRTLLRSTTSLFPSDSSQAVAQK